MAPAPHAQTSAIDRLLDCVAGFHANEADARRISGQMMAAHGLVPSQLMLLRPADAAWLPFRSRRRVWARGANADGQTWLGDAGLMASLGGLAGGLFSAVWLWVDSQLELGMGGGWEPAVFSAAVTLGALAGHALAGKVGQTPQHRHFDAVVRHQLASGRWVVLAHDLRWEQQAGVVKLAREQGLDWCAVASSRPWL
ncbi:MAG: hypothetical protein Q7U73_00400 [Rubrivivax sp.]|nr:hypothetical protein [Rubrivivax sp.]